MKPRLTTKLCQKLRRSQTDAEKRLWYFLRKDALGVKFRRQFAIENYVVDFCCLEKKLVIELDGGQHREMETADQKRTAVLASKAYVVLRFWDDDALKNTKEVLERIYSELNKVVPHLTSPVLPGEEK